VIGHKGRLCFCVYPSFATDANANLPLSLGINAKGWSEIAPPGPLKMLKMEGGGHQKEVWRASESGAMSIVPFVATIAWRIIDVIGHFVARVGHELFSPVAFLPADEIQCETCGKGSSEGCQCDSLRSLHMRTLVRLCNSNAKSADAVV
jgi:hypothetical protein